MKRRHASAKQLDAPLTDAKRKSEVELKFLVPAQARKKVAAEVARAITKVARTSLVARYLDTADRRLAREGLAWRLRREGRRWVQTLKAGSPNPLVRFEHEVERPGASHDAEVHAGTPVGDRLIAVLRKAAARGEQADVRFATEVRRTWRRVRLRGAVVEIAFDEGRILAAGTTLRIREIEFELVAGSAAALLALAERWRRRFGLVYDPRSKAERGDRLAQGSPFPSLRKAVLPRYAGDASAADAFAAVLDECLAQVTGNAIGLIEGDAALRTAHVHQLRIGIRRLRSALRSFRGWTPAPPGDLVAGLRALFASLGKVRDNDVLDSSVVAQLARLGAPALALPAGSASPDPSALVCSTEVQRCLLAWITWRASLAAAPDGPVSGGKDAARAEDPQDQGALRSRRTPRSSDDAQAPDRTPPAADAASPDHTDAPRLHRLAERRLRRWHRRILADLAAFDALDDTGLHALRKRIKRQRYAVEFFAPALRRRPVERYLDALSVVQEHMGALNDLFVARARYESLVESDPAAWFALGWLAARVAEVRALARTALVQLAQVKPPGN
jgi:triphosphatase